jgi:hypothetical protein
MKADASPGQRIRDTRALRAGRPPRSDVAPAQVLELRLQGLSFRAFYSPLDTAARY